MQGHSWSHSELYRLVWSLYLRPCLGKTQLNWKWRLNDHPPEEKQTGEAGFQAGQLCAPSGLTDIPLTNSLRKELPFTRLGRCVVYSRCLVPQGSATCSDQKGLLRGPAAAGAGVWPWKEPPPKAQDLNRDSQW